MMLTSTFNRRTLKTAVLVIAFTGCTEKQSSPAVLSDPLDQLVRRDSQIVEVEHQVACVTAGSRGNERKVCEILKAAQAPIRSGLRSHASGKRDLYVFALFVQRHDGRDGLFTARIDVGPFEDLAACVSAETIAREAALGTQRCMTYSDRLSELREVP
jgi:hypothetical protein